MNWKHTLHFRSASLAVDCTLDWDNYAYARLVSMRTIILDLGQIAARFFVDGVTGLFKVWDALGQDAA